MINSLDVYIWSHKVGTLIAYKQKYVSKSCFYFDADFIKGNLDIAPLRASIKSAAIQNGLPVYADDEKIFGGLPSFIADSLPDYWGNKIFDQWAKLNHIRLHDITSLDRLTYMGSRAMGALEFVPSAALEMEKPFKVEISKLYNIAKVALDKAKLFHADLDSDLMLQSLFKVGTSAGGRRPKAILNVNLNSMQCYSGQVAAPAPGYTPMIIKFDEHNDIPTTRIEYSYYLMANAVGLNMMPSQLLADADNCHFITERFDRCGDTKIHIQTLAAMNPLASSYESLFDVANRIAIPYSELHLLFLSMVMNVIAANVDDHNKNFSFMMNQDGVWHLAPTYDFTFSVDPTSPWYVNRHSLTINGKDTNINRNDLNIVARQFNIKRPDEIIDKAIDIVKRYDEYAQSANLDDYWIDKIRQEQTSRIEAL